MLTSIHFILTYQCNFQCDHCFLYCHPYAQGTFTMAQVREALDQFEALGTVRSVGFEGGEAFLFYPLLRESVQMASERGFKTALQTNCYWATANEDAKLWLKPLKTAGLSIIEVSDDHFHHGEAVDSPAKRALSAALELDLPHRSICITEPEVGLAEDQLKGDPIYLGGPKLRGRAMDKLIDGLPTQSWDRFTQCPFEDLENPSRVHLDPFGNLHLCQGIIMGNIWRTPLATIVTQYQPDQHPICGPILKGGPAQLARHYALAHADQYVDACHLCSKLCLALIDRFPQYLGPRQVYGLT